MPLLGSDVRFFLSLVRNPEDRKDAIRWRKLRSPGSPMTAAIPWIPFRAIDFLQRRDLSGARIFEWGSGGSTLYWTSRNAETIISIEHDANWYALVRERVGGRADLRLVEPVVDNSAAADDVGDPDAAVSADPASSGLRFTAYVEAIDSFADESFDVVLIDGRARPSCIHHGAPKVRQGGILIVDNADRDYYLAQTASCLEGFFARWFSGATPGLSMRSTTAIFTRERIVRCAGSHK